MDNFLEVKDLSKQYGMAPPVISNLNARFNAGSITGLIGKNGSGKSTFMKLLAMVSLPDSGSIVYDNTDIWQDASFYLPKTGVVSDWFQLPETLSFDELITWQMEERGLQAKEIETRLAELKEEFHFDERSKLVIRTYSSGMRKKAAICAALCFNPSILLFDEPFQALDVESRTILYQRLEHERENGKIILLSSHLNEEQSGLYDQLIQFPLK